MKAVPRRSRRGVFQLDGSLLDDGAIVACTYDSQATHRVLVHIRFLHTFPLRLMTLFTLISVPCVQDELSKELEEMEAQMRDEELMEAPAVPTRKVRSKFLSFAAV